MRALGERVGAIRELRKMATVTTSAIGVKPNEVIVTLESDNGPVNLHFQAAGAAQFARDMSTAAT